MQTISKTADEIERKLETLKGSIFVTVEMSFKEGAEPLDLSYYQQHLESILHAIDNPPAPVWTPDA